MNAIQIDIDGGAENAGRENDGTNWHDMKMQDMK